jgi:hypothetical protein
MMHRKFTMAAALLIAFVCAGIAGTRVADGPKIDGKWVGQIPRPNHNYDAVFEFKVEGEKLTGNVNSEGMDFEIVNGKVKGDTVSFRLGSTQGNYTAKVSGDEMTGKVAFSGGEFGSRTMDFKLTRMKE